MPIINDFAIVADLHRVNIQLATAQINQVPPALDLLALTFSSAKATYTVAEFKLELEKTSTKDLDYNLRINISVDGQALGFLLTDRKKKDGYNKHLRPLHVANEAFYTLEYGKLLLRFLHAFGLEIANHSQIDIAIDTQQLDPALLIHSYTGNPAEYQRVQRKNGKAPRTEGELDEATGSHSYTTYWNKGSQTVSVKAYNKTIELLKKPKPYLHDWHVANGFDPSKPVYRLEVTIKSNALKNYRPFAVTEDGEEISVYSAANNNALSKATKHTEITTLNIEMDRLNNKAYLASLFQYFFRKVIDIRRRDASRKTNCTRVQLIAFAIFGEEEINKTVSQRPMMDTFAAQKKMLRQHVLDYRDTGNELYLAVAHDTAMRHNLNDRLDLMLFELLPRQRRCTFQENAKRLRAEVNWNSPVLTRLCVR